MKRPVPATLYDGWLCDIERSETRYALVVMVLPGRVASFWPVEEIPPGWRAWNYDVEMAPEPFASVPDGMDTTAVAEVVRRHFRSP